MTPFKGKNRVTSPYGWRNLNGKRQWHAGQDIVGDDSHNVRAIWAGRCEVVKGRNGGRGNTVYLYFSAIMRVLCQHLADIYVKNGQTVKQGQEIGLMGNTGDSYGAHLHIEVQQLVNGRWTAIAPAVYTEVPNIARTHPGNDHMDGGQEPPPYKPPANTVVLAVGPMSAGDRETLEKLAGSLALSCMVQKGGDNETTLLIGPMTAGDKAAVEAKAAALRLPCKEWVGETRLQIGPASAGDAATLQKKTAELGAVMQEADAGTELKLLTTGPLSPAQKQVMEALAAKLLLPVGVV